ncbi:CIC11C00000002887 [Sungouiella intermedia]|uniref:CIC11C00000002887 n=1 Tax=Sungouiella intermedia TaxID=45354 RepID=A0A1L0BBC8_9ASCO|nr:CIC11C00000002887 [[Candida] intermedia]
MSKHLAKDSSVWNKIMYGRSRVPSPVLAVSSGEKGLKNDEVFIEFEDKERNSPTDKSPSKRKQYVDFVLAFIIGVYVFWKFSAIDHRGCLNMATIELVAGSASRYGGFVDSGSYSDQSKGAKEVLSVAYPLNPKKRYGEPVHSEVLVNHTFDSWGHPNLVAFKPPKTPFTNVVLTLKTTVNGIQYDRLAHLYVGGAEIWRTSTIEPGSREVFSEFKKDVSSYASLFQKKTDILFQLDNIVSDWLTGKFHIELTADFYESKHVSTDSEEGTIADQYLVFDVRKPASKVYPLVDKKDSRSPPIEYLPTDTFVFKLPEVSKNTTRLKLAAFVSGNGNEEFWYSNVLDRFTDRFQKDGTILLGHGPTRFLNVYVDGQKIASQAPQPFIFTGGYSPSLWNPVVAIDAFDLPSVDIDVTGLLPLLWESGEHELTITVDNGLDEIEGGSSGIGHDWIASANLLTYESNDVVGSSGKILHIGERSKGNSIGVAPPYTGTLLQVVNAIFQEQLTSEIVLKLRDGTTLNTTVSTFTKGEISNVQQYSHLGNSARIVHVGHSSKSFLLTDNLNEGDIVHQTNVSLSYPLVISLSETPAEDGVDLDFKIVNSKLITLDINDNRIMAETIAQNGTSLFHIRPNGNHGNGALTTKLKFQVTGTSGDFKFKRRVESEDGEILSDEEKYEEIDEDDWKEISQEIKHMSTIHKGCGRHSH